MCVHAQSLQSCPTLCDPTDCSPPSSSVHEILQARILAWAAITSFRASPDPGIEPRSPALKADPLQPSHWGSPSPLTYELVSCELSKMRICLHLSIHEWLLQLLCTRLRSGPVPHLLTAPPQIKKIPLMFFLCHELLRFFSSTSYLTDASALASRHPGLELMILYCCCYC